jgi:hypothetical protein
MRCAKSRLPIHGVFVASIELYHLLSRPKSLKTFVIQMNHIRGLPSVNVNEDGLSILGFLGNVPHPNIKDEAHFAIGHAVSR